MKRVRKRNRIKYNILIFKRSKEKRKPYDLIYKYKTRVKDMVEYTLYIIGNFKGGRLIIITF